VFADEVDTAATAAFEAAYGPDGGWARSSGTPTGYRGTGFWRGERGRHLALGRFAAV
jgi:hypothetical protein